MTNIASEFWQWLNRLLTAQPALGVLLGLALTVLLVPAWRRSVKTWLSLYSPLEERLISKALDRYCDAMYRHRERTLTAFLLRQGVMMLYGIVVIFFMINNIVSNDLFHVSIQWVALIFAFWMMKDAGGYFLSFFDYAGSVTYPVGRLMVLKERAFKLRNASPHRYQRIEPVLQKAEEWGRLNFPHRFPEAGLMQSSGAASSVSDSPVHGDHPQTSGQAASEKAP